MLHFQHDGKIMRWAIIEYEVQGYAWLHSIDLCAMYVLSMHFLSLYWSQFSLAQLVVLLEVEPVLPFVGVYTGFLILSVVPVHYCPNSMFTIHFLLLRSTTTRLVHANFYFFYRLQASDLAQVVQDSSTTALTHEKQTDAVLSACAQVAFHAPPWIFSAHVSHTSAGVFE